MFVGFLGKYQGNVIVSYSLQDKHLNLRVYREEQDDVDQETWEAVVTYVNFFENLYLSTIYEVWRKVLFSQACVIHNKTQKRNKDMTNIRLRCLISHFLTNIGVLCTSETAETQSFPSNKDLREENLES